MPELLPSASRREREDDPVKGSKVGRLLSPESVIYSDASLSLVFVQIHLPKLWLIISRLSSEQVRAGLCYLLLYSITDWVTTYRAGPSELLVLLQSMSLLLLLLPCMRLILGVGTRSEHAAMEIGALENTSSHRSRKPSSSLTSITTPHTTLTLHTLTKSYKIILMLSTRTSSGESLSLSVLFVC